MYQITDHPCPDVLHCQWERSGSVTLTRIPRRVLQEECRQAIAAGLRLKAVRIKVLLAR